MNQPRRLWQFEMIGCVVANERSYAHDPGPYSGVGVSCPPVTVQDANGEAGELHLHQTNSA